MSLAPDKYPPKVINLFEAAKEEIAKAPPAPTRRPRRGRAEAAWSHHGEQLRGGQRLCGNLHQDGHLPLRRTRPP